MAAVNCLLLLLAVGLFSSLTVAQSVAPNDLHPYCLTRPGRKPSFSNEKVLLDTQNYNSTTLLAPNGANRTWLSIDIDSGPSSPAANRWVDANQLLQCEHNLTACSRVANQANWMITQYINISQSGVQRLTVNVTFASNFMCQSCGQQTYEIYTYQTDEIDEAGRGNISMYSFAEVRLIHTANTGPTFASQTFTVTTSGFYLAMLDSGVGGGCTVVNRISVYYNICPYQIQNMVMYPETVAPTDAFNDIPVTATCVNDSSPSSSDLQLFCRLSGRWTGDVSCTCNPGYEPFNMSCEACLEGSYKSVQGNVFCKECPENSDSTSPASTGCGCLPGYFRTNTETVDDNCTAPPSAPEDLRNTSVSAFTINITWTASSDTGGRTDLFYTVNITDGNSSNETNTSETWYSLTRLIPSTTYTIRVIAKNGVSNQDAINIANRTVSIVTTTLSFLPSSPRGVTLEVVDNQALLTWTAPTNLYGTLSEYRILLSMSNNTDTAQVRATVSPSVESYDLRMLDIAAGTYFVWVQAVTENGAGDFSAPVRYTHQAASTSNLPIIVGGTAGVVALILIIVAILVIALVVVCLIGRRTRKENSYNLPNANYTHNGQIELNTMIGTPNPNRMYIDPRTYASISHAFEQNSIKEIPPKEITSMEEIGVGEFGLVYKAQWTSENKPVAVKTLRGGATEEMRENFLFEASVMGQFHHENVILLYGVISRVDPVMIVMEYLHNGSLDRYLQKNLDKISEERLSKMSYGIARGMSYLSKIGYVHRDLAARNVLVAKDETCKVADFGLARELVDNEYDVHKGGRIPVRWTAPEAISHRSFTTASDVWSYGVLLWEIFAFGETPYEGWDNASLFDRLENGERLHQPRNCPDDIYQMMLSCWNAERSERPTFEQIMECFEVLLFGKPKPKPKPAHLRSPIRDPSPPPANQAPPIIPTRNVSGMTIDDLLASISMTRYTELFHRNGYHMVADCFSLTEDTLQKIGVTLSGHQYKIIKNIRLKEEELGRVSPDYI